MNFNTPREIYFGWGSVGALEKLSDAVIVTGSKVWKEVSDFVPLDVEVYELSRTSRTGEPHQEDVDKVAEFLKDVSPKWIVAVGGGSVIDTAKLAWIFYEHDDIRWADVYSGAKLHLRNRARLAAVETTSGTGSGISAAAVVTDENKLKHGVVSQEIVPDIAVYDPDMVMSMPDSTVIYSGMDALTHAIEAYVSKVENLPAETMALKAIELVFANIKHSREREPGAREHMHYANMMAAMGFANARLGLCHAASHKIGGRYEVEHGKINAIMLPHFIRATYNLTRKYEDIERMLRLDDLARAVEELNEDFGIPFTFPQIKNDIESLADEIMKDGLMRYNPGKMSREDVIAFLRNVAGL